MSAFSHRLNQLILEDFKGVRRHCAQKIGTSESMLCRYLEEDRRPSRPFMQRLVQRLKPHQSAPLLTAHFKDETPKRLEDHISVTIDGRPQPTKKIPGFGDLSEESQEAIRMLVRRMLEDRQVEQAYLGLLNVNFGGSKKQRHPLC